MYLFEPTPGSAALDFQRARGTGAQDYNRAKGSGLYTGLDFGNKAPQPTSTLPGTPAPTRPAAEATEQPRTLKSWPIVEGFMGPEVREEVRFGLQALDDLNYLRTLISGELTNPTTAARLALANSSDAARVRQAADALGQILAAAQNSLATVVPALFNEAGRGFQAVAGAFSEVAGEVDAWQGQMPPSIQDAVKRFTLQWRDVAQATSKRYYLAERMYADLMLDLTNAAALQARLWQLMGALYEAKINALQASIEKLQQGQGQFRQAADAFVKLIEQGTAVAERALKAVGNTLGLGSVGPIFAIGALAIAALLIFKKR